MIVLVTAIGCTTGIVLVVIDKVTHRGRHEARLRDERIRLLELENAQLRQQLEWHDRLLDAGPTGSASRPRS